MSKPEIQILTMGDGIKRLRQQKCDQKNEIEV